MRESTSLMETAVADYHEMVRAKIRELSADAKPDDLLVVTLSTENDLHVIESNEENPPRSPF